MKKVHKINDIILDNDLFISSEFEVNDYVSSRSLAVDGSSVIFVQEKGSMSKEVTITSKSSGWINKTTKDLLMQNVGIDPITLLFNDGSSATYYYDHTKIPIRFTALYEGSLWYNVEINLIKG